VEAKDTLLDGIVCIIVERMRTKCLIPNMLYQQAIVGSSWASRLGDVRCRGQEPEQQNGRGRGVGLGRYGLGFRPWSEPGQKPSVVDFGVR